MDEAGTGDPQARDLSHILEDLLSGSHDPLGRIERLMRLAADVLSRPARSDGRSEAADGKGFVQTLAQIVSLALEKPDLLAEHLAAFAGQAIEILQLQVADLEPSPED